MAAFYWTPGIANGWAPKLAYNDGRYLIYGIIEQRGVDFFAGGGPVITDLTVGIPDQCFSQGFWDPSHAYISRFDSPGTLYSFNPTAAWARTTVFTGSRALGSYINAEQNHWGTLNSGIYSVDGASFTPAQPANGFNIAGSYCCYASGDFASLIVQNIDGSNVRSFVPPGPVNFYRLFAGPDGGYLFFAANGQIWINTPTNLTIQANLPNTSASEAFGALVWRSGQLWVWTYALNPNDGIYYALGRPVGDANCIQLPNIAANNFSMQIGQYTTGWVVAGANDGNLGVWVDVPYTTDRFSFLGSSGQGPTPGGGGGGGGSTTGPGTPGRSVINARVAPPPPVREPRRYPHVDQIEHFPTRQSLRLAWDQMGDHKTAITALQATTSTQANEIAALKAEIAALKRQSNVAYKNLPE